jgi:hypothetical protein
VAEASLAPPFVAFRADQLCGSKLKTVLHHKAGMSRSRRVSKLSEPKRQKILIVLIHSLNGCKIRPEVCLHLLTLKNVDLFAIS